MRRPVLTGGEGRSVPLRRRITVGDSSLSATTQAVIAAEVGLLDLAHAYARQAALVDLQDRDDDTEDGLHMASLAGAWIALVCGFGGLRDHHDPFRDDDDRLRFAPRLPDGIKRLAFAVSWRGCWFGWRSSAIESATSSTVLRDSRSFITVRLSRSTRSAAGTGHSRTGAAHRPADSADRPRSRAANPKLIVNLGLTSPSSTWG